MEKSQLIESVIYPGLKSHPQHEVAKKQMRGYGGIISFRLKGAKEQVSKFLKSLKIFTLA
jgi:cystathionine gamma-lyase